MQKLKLTNNFAGLVTSVLGTTVAAGRQLSQCNMNRMTL
jgi:hypothetical protein